MIRLSSIARTSIGKKALMAMSGLGLFVFLLIHLAGNLNMFSGRDAMNEYAANLHEHPILVWGARSGLLLFFLLHVVMGVRLWLENRRARPQRYRKNATLRASWASRNMILTGLVLLSFIVYHLLHFTLGVTDPGHFALSLQPDMLGRPDVYSMVVYGFRNPLVAGSYIVAMGFVGLHLWHGVQSTFQSIGLHHSAYNRIVRGGAKAVVFLLIVGFWALPVSVLCGLLLLPGEG